MQRKKQKRILKILLPVSLLIQLAMQTSYAENGSRLPSVLKPKYGIELTRSYTGREVLELIDIVVEESEKNIIEAFNAGYKKGILEFKPDVEYWKVKALGFEKELKRQRRDRWLYGLGGFALGFAGGAGIGFGVRIRY